jgi:LPS-assembly lipoprotein
MSSFRVYFLVGILGILGSCGFQPLYGGAKNQAINQELAHIQILRIESRTGHQLHNLLLDQLNPRGRSDEPLYTLNVRINASTENIGLKFDNVTTRAKLTLKAEFVLTNKRSGKALSKGSARSVNSYNISLSEYGRLITEIDAKKRAVREISDILKTRLSLYFLKRGT